MSYFTLSNGVKIPDIGYGTYKTPSGDECVNGVKFAIENGYRLIDTAYFYGNEASVKDGINDSNVCHNDIFLTTKLWNDEHGYDNAMRAFDKSMKNLDRDVVDLYLIHWPIPLAHKDDWQTVLPDTWHALETLYRDGRVRAIGVCNCTEKHLKFLSDNCQIAPMVNQIEMHVGYPQTQTLCFCKKQGVVVEAWAPLARAKAFDLPEVVAIANNSNKTPAQVLIRWCIEKGVIPLPKSVTPARIIENMKVFDFKLSEVEMSVLDSVNAVGRLGSHPDDCKF